MRFDFVALAHKGHGAPLGKTLEQAERKLLAVVFDRVIAAIDGLGFKQLFPEAIAELFPRDASLLKCS